MTEELFATDAYARTCQASVMDAGTDGVVLDRTVFYARSGGQPGDTGWLMWGGGKARVIDTIRTRGTLEHVIEGVPPSIGTHVTAEIDWDAGTSSCGPTPRSTRYRGSYGGTTARR